MTLQQAIMTLISKWEAERKQNENDATFFAGAVEGARVILSHITPAEQGNEQSDTVSEAVQTEEA